jgi:hypothetical protein
MKMVTRCLPPCNVDELWFTSMYYCFSITPCNVKIRSFTSDAISKLALMLTSDAIYFINYTLKRKKEKKIRERILT